jgi:hypothetical protein
MDSHLRASVPHELPTRGRPHFLVTWAPYSMMQLEVQQLASLGWEDKRVWVRWKLQSSETFHYFCCILFVRGKSLGLLYTYGEGITKFVALIRVLQRNKVNRMSNKLDTWEGRWCKSEHLGAGGISPIWAWRPENQQSWCPRAGVSGCLSSSTEDGFDCPPLFFSLLYSGPPWIGHLLGGSSAQLSSSLQMLISSTNILIDTWSFTSYLGILKLSQVDS